MKLYLILQSAVVVLGALAIGHFFSDGGAASYLLGGILILVNVSLLAIAWYFIRKKKLIALSVILIVFKYAILGVIIYRILKLPWIDPKWFCVGLGSLLPATLLFGLIVGLQKPEED